MSWYDLPPPEFFMKHDDVKEKSSISEVDEKSISEVDEKVIASEKIKMNLNSLLFDLFLLITLIGGIFILALCITGEDKIGILIFSIVMTLSIVNIWLIVIDICSIAFDIYYLSKKAKGKT